jgi:endonuclease/exonuclease/phosphatase family metal-dependent hydrolase
MSLRVASFNIHHGVGLDGVLDLDRTAALIRATAAEIVGLQEVDRHLSVRSGWVDQAGGLAERLGMHVAFGANIDLDPDERRGPDSPRRHYGNAVLSAHPIDAWRNIPLPGRDGAEPRGLLTVRLAVAGADLIVGCTHLQNRSAAERVAQAARVVEVLTPPTPPTPTVLLGDMNAGPAAAAVRALTATFTDAWAVAGTVRFSGSGGLTFDAATPHARIDYVLTSGPIRPQAAWVVPTDASDHRPVVADLSI